MNRELFLCVLINLCLATTAFPQTRPQYAPMDSAKGPDGVFWYCYGDNGPGIAKFDGIFWTTYTKENSGIPGNIVYRLDVDLENQVWIVIADLPGIVKFDGSTWVTYYYGCYGSDVAVDRNGVIWITYITPDSMRMWSYAAYYDGATWHSYPIQSSNRYQHFFIFIDQNNLKCFTTDYMNTKQCNIIYNDSDWVRYDVEYTKTSYELDSLWYPLQMGNTWTYQRKMSEMHHILIEDVVTVSIIGTRMIEGNQYACFLDGRCFRVDDYRNIWIQGKLYYNVSAVYQGIYQIEEIIVPAGQYQGVMFRFPEKPGIDMIMPELSFLTPGIGQIYYSFSTDYGIFEKWELLSATINGQQIPSAVIESAKPIQFVLQNFPNPFNSSTTITFTIPSDTPATLAIYSISGQKVRELMNGTQSAGTHSAIWNGRDERGNPVSSGIYFARLETGKQAQIRKMLIVK